MPSREAARGWARDPPTQCSHHKGLPSRARGRLPAEQRGTNLGGVPAEDGAGTPAGLPAGRPRLPDPGGRSQRRQPSGTARRALAGRAWEAPPGLAPWRRRGATWQAQGGLSPTVHDQAAGHENGTRRGHALQSQSHGGSGAAHRLGAAGPVWGTGRLPRDPPGPVPRPPPRAHIPAPGRTSREHPGSLDLNKEPPPSPWAPRASPGPSAAHKPPPSPAPVRPPGHWDAPHLQGAHARCAGWVAPVAAGCGQHAEP